MLSIFFLIKNILLKRIALARPISATFARQTEQGCKEGGSLVITINLAKSEILINLANLRPN